MDNTQVQSKEELIKTIDERVRDKIFQSQDAAMLKKLINEKDITLDEAIDIFKLGTFYKRTGLHFKPRLEKRGNDIHYLTKNEDLSFNVNDKGLTHKLIIGENYDALQNLLVSHKGKIDLIYIDPPYGKDSMGEFAKTNYENAITRDNLLSMLQARLILARELLSDEGIIFCSIDDKNQAYVKCLFDDVFGERNFLLNICVNKTSDIASSYTIQKHEYVLVYVKDVDKYELKEKEKFTISRGTVGNSDQTMPIITFPAGLNCYGIKDGEYKETRKIEGSNENVENLDTIIVKNGKLAKEVRLKARWRSSNDMRNFFKNNCQPTKAKINGEIVEIYFENDRFNPQIKKKTYEKIPSLFLENTRGSGDLSDLGLTEVFDFPKSVLFMQYLLNFTNKQAIILDFFAGTGTMGHAVLAANEEDDGKRQFILCQMNEKTDKTPNGIVSDCTSKRLKRVMTGKCYDGTNDFKWLKKNQPYKDNLDVYEIKTVANFENRKGKSAFDVIDETLYGQDKFKTIKEKIDWVCLKFGNTQKTVESDADWKNRREGK